LALLTSRPKFHSNQQLKFSGHNKDKTKLEHMAWYTLGMLKYERGGVNKWKC